MIRTPNQVYMQNLSQIGEPACPQIFDLAPFLRTIALKKGKHSPIFLFCLFVCLFVFSYRPANTHMRGLGAAVFGVMVRGWGAHQKINATRPSKWGRRIIIQRKKSTASPFVATFPATNLLVFFIILQFINKKKDNKI